MTPLQVILISAAGVALGLLVGWIAGEVLHAGGKSNEAAAEVRDDFHGERAC